MNRKLVVTLAMMVLALCVASVPAVAGSAPMTDTLSLTLASPIQQSPAGEFLNFYATVMAPGGNSGPLYLNGDSFNVSFPLMLDDTPFLFNYPLVMNPGDGFSGVLFTIFIPAGTPVGDYTGFFQILGGDANNPGGLDAISNLVQFEVQVPEPSALWMMLSCGGLAFAGFARFKLLA